MAVPLEPWKLSLTLFRVKQALPQTRSSQHRMWPEPVSPGGLHLYACGRNMYGYLVVRSSACGELYLPARFPLAAPHSQAARKNSEGRARSLSLGFSRSLACAKPSRPWNKIFLRPPVSSIANARIVIADPTSSLSSHGASLGRSFPPEIAPRRCQHFCAANWARSARCNSPPNSTLPTGRRTAYPYIIFAYAVPPPQPPILRPSYPLYHDITRAASFDYYPNRPRLSCVLAQ